MQITIPGLLTGPPLLHVLYDPQGAFWHFAPRGCIGTSENLAKVIYSKNCKVKKLVRNVFTWWQSLHKIVTKKFWYSTGIGVDAISSSNIRQYWNRRTNIYIVIYYQIFTLVPIPSASSIFGRPGRHSDHDE